MPVPFYFTWSNLSILHYNYEEFNKVEDKGISSAEFNLLEIHLLPSGTSNEAGRIRTSFRQIQRI